MLNTPALTFLNSLPMSLFAGPERNIQAVTREDFFADSERYGQYVAKYTVQFSCVHVLLTVLTRLRRGGSST